MSSLAARPSFIIQPAGEVEASSWPEDSAGQLAAMQEVVSGYIEYLPLPFHILQRHEAAPNEEGLR